MSLSDQHTELTLPNCEAAQGKPVRIEHSLLFQLLNYAQSGRATVGGPGSEDIPPEPNKYMELESREGIAALLGDLIAVESLLVHLEGSKTPSVIKATDEGEYWWVGITA